MPRTMRLCDVCFQYDEDPRHVQALDPTVGGGRVSIEDLSKVPQEASATAVAELVDPDTHVRHLDCCAAQGCPSCAAQLALADNAKGVDLLRHIQKNAEEHAAAVENL